MDLLEMGLIVLVSVDTRESLSSYSFKSNKLMQKRKAFGKAFFIILP